MAEIKLVGSKFLKLSAERNRDFNGKITLKTNIKKKSLEKTKGSKDTLTLHYGFEADYGELGRVDIEGLLYLSGDSKTLKELQKNFKGKDIDSKEQLAITNLILQKASIKALQLEDELGMPAHIKLPSISPKKWFFDFK